MLFKGDSGFAESGFDRGVFTFQGECAGFGESVIDGFERVFGEVDRKGGVGVERESLRFAQASHEAIHGGRAVGLTALGKDFPEERDAVELVRHLVKRLILLGEPLAGLEGMERERAKVADGRLDRGGLDGSGGLGLVVVAALKAALVAAATGGTADGIAQLGDAAAQSGGALVNLRGELAGINTAIISPQGGGNIGIGLAIPINLALIPFDRINMILTNVCYSCAATIRSVPVGIPMNSAMNIVVGIDMFHNIYFSTAWPTHTWEVSTQHPESGP